MLQISEARRAAWEGHRALRDFQEARALLGHLAAANVRSYRLSNSPDASTQAMRLHADATKKIPMGEAFKHIAAESVQVFPRPRDYSSFMPIGSDWGAHTVPDGGTAPTLLETGIEELLGPGIMVLTHDAESPAGDTVNKGKPAQQMPGVFEAAFPGDLVGHVLDQPLDTVAEVFSVGHGAPRPMFIPYTQTGAQDPSARPPGLVLETDDKAALLDRLTNIVREASAVVIWEYATRRSAATSEPDPVEVISHIPPQLEGLFREIEGLPENWNSYGAARISSWSIVEARKIVNEGMGLGLLAPAVSPASGGSVGIEWQTDNAELVIDVDPQQGVTYLVVERASGAEIEGELNADNQSEVLRKAMGL